MNRDDFSRDPGRAWEDDFDDWSLEDDDLVRGALLTLRDDVERTPLPEPAFVRASAGRQRQSQRRPLVWIGAAAAAAVAVAAIAFSQLGNPNAAELTPGQTTTATAATPTEPTTDATAVDGGTTAPTSEPTGGTATTDTTTTDTTTTDAATEPTVDPTYDPANDPESLGPQPGQVFLPCYAVFNEPVSDGLSPQQQEAAFALMSAAGTCDANTLIAYATNDETALSFGVLTPEEAFTMRPEDDPENRFRVLSLLLTTIPQLEDGLARWPAEPQTEDDWQALVDLGVITADNVDQMRSYGSGYTGYRVVIAEDGT